DVIYEISRKGLGMTIVTDASGMLAGVVTDGDLRRLMQTKRSEIFELAAEECMTRGPVTIGPSELASAAALLMEQRHITAVVVADPQGRALGVLHLHALWAQDQQQ